MESLNSSLKNIIQFILCVQDASDKHRKSMEYLWQQEYNLYIKEWKPSHTESKLPDVNNKGITSDCASKCVKMNLEDKELTDADLELALADSLLEKARIIRTKSKKLLNGLVDCRNLPTFCTDKVITSSANCNLKQVPDIVKSKNKLPQSKSDVTINNRKTYIVPRSKSANAPLMPKNSAETLHDTKSCTVMSSKINTVKHATSASNKLSKDFAVISSKDLNKLRNVQSNLPSCHNSKGRKVAPCSDSSENRSQPQAFYPSSVEFSNLMKDKLNIVSCEVKLRIWYPFLSPKSEAYLTSFNCNSFSSIKKLYSILFSIQETMVWIDLLYLLETEICSNLIMDKTDVNSLRVFSYLRSICHPNFQRIPIIFPSKN